MKSVFLLFLDNLNTIVSIGFCVVPVIVYLFIRHHNKRVGNGKAEAPADKSDDERPAALRSGGN